MSAAGRSFRGPAPQPILALAARTRDLGELPAIAARYGRELAVELTVEVTTEPAAERERVHGSDGETASDTAADRNAAPVLGLRAPLATFTQSRATHEAPAAATGPDAVTESMDRLRALRARRLVLFDNVALHDTERARSLGRLLDGTAARFQGQGFQLGYEPSFDAANTEANTEVNTDECVRGLVALATQITMPAFFLALGGDRLAAIGELAWGRALAPLVRQVYLPLVTRRDDPWAARSDAGDVTSSLAALVSLEAIVLATDDFLAFHTAGRAGARPGSPGPAAPESRSTYSTIRNLPAALAETLQKLADSGLSGLSRSAPLP